MRVEPAAEPIAQTTDEAVMHDWLAEHLGDETPEIAGRELHKAKAEEVPASAPTVKAANAPNSHGPASTAGGHSAADDDVNGPAKRARAWLLSTVGATSAGIMLAFFAFSGDSDLSTAAPPAAPPLTPVVVAVPSSPEPQAAPVEQAIPFDPSTQSCDGGPTSPLALTNINNESAWVCSRGPQESRIDGQILRVKFLCEKSRPDSTCSYMLNSLSVTPGWVTKATGGKDEWLEHRVPTIMQFNFYNGDQLAADPFFLDTKGVRGSIPATLSGKTLASRVDVMILHTARPSAAPLDSDHNKQGPSDTAGGFSLSNGDMFSPATPSDSATGADPVDATFALSELQFFGHSPS